MRPSCFLFIQGHRSHHGSSTIMTSPSLHYLPNTPPPNIEIKTSTYKFGWTHSVQSKGAVTDSNCDKLCILKLLSAQNWHCHCPHSIGQSSHGAKPEVEEGGMYILYFEREKIFGRTVQFGTLYWAKTGTLGYMMLVS